jgi:hypothetical protein
VEPWDVSRFYDFLLLITKNRQSFDAADCKLQVAVGVARVVKRAEFPGEKSSAEMSQAPD